MLPTPKRTGNAECRIPLQKQQPASCEAGRSKILRDETSANQHQEHCPANRATPGRWETSALLLFLFLGRIALRADLAILLGLDTALVFAVFTGGFRLVTAGFGANDGYAAKQSDGAEDCTEGLHVLPFLPLDSRRHFCFVFLEPQESLKRLSSNAMRLNYQRTITASP